MKKITILLIVLLASCADISRVDKPDSFYGDDKMASIFVDLYLMEAVMTSNRGMFASLKTLPGDFIYNKYETDSIAFAENLNYYSDNGDAYKELLKQVEERITILKDTVALRQKRATQHNNYPQETEKILLEKDPDN